jgi:hypothetical protein
VDNARPRTSWGDAVARIDTDDHRSSRDIRTSLAAWASLISDNGHDRLNPIERRRRATSALIDALAAYRLAGGTLEHLHRVLGRTNFAGYDDDVAGSVGDRARLARARIELALEVAGYELSDFDADEHASRVADVEQRAAALERPRPAADEQPPAAVSNDTAARPDRDPASPDNEHTDDD